MGGVAPDIIPDFSDAGIRLIMPVRNERNGHMNQESLTPEQVSAIAAEAYIYAFPLLMGYRYG